MERPTVKLVKEGRYLAEVPVTLIEDDTAWSPYLTPGDALKLDAVRQALRDGDIAAAKKQQARAFELLPLSA